MRDRKSFLPMLKPCTRSLARVAGLVALCAAAAGAQKAWEMPFWYPYVIGGSIVLRTQQYGGMIYALSTQGFAKAASPYRDWEWKSLLPSDLAAIDERTIDAMSFSDSAHGYVLMDHKASASAPTRKILLKTSDAGETWSPRYSAKAVTDIACPQKDTCLGIDDSGIVKTGSAGAAWDRKFKSKWKLYRIQAFANSAAFALGEGGVILRSADNGEKWDSVHYGGGKAMTEMFMVDEKTGYAIGQTLAFKTTDGGMSWTQLTVTGIAYNLNAVKFKDADNGYMVGEQGKIYKTSDGGDHWQITVAGTDSTNPNVTNLRAYNALELTGANSALALGKLSVGGDFATLAITEDGGSSWFASGLLTPFQGITSAWYFSKDKTLVGTVAGKVSQLANDLRSAIVEDALGILNSIGNLAGSSVASLRFLNADKGFAVLAGGEIDRTADGGKTWSDFLSKTPILKDMALLGETRYLAVGAKGAMLETEDAGKLWFGFQGPYASLSRDSGKTWKDTAVAHFAWTGDLNSIAFDPDNAVGLIAGSGGALLRSADAGATWDTVHSGITTDLYRVRFTDKSTAYAVGDKGALLVSKDGGATWTRQISGSTYALRDIGFVDAKTGYCVGNNMILYTSDGGSNWSAVSQLSGTPLSPATGVTWNQLIIADSATVYVYGADNYQNAPMLARTVGAITPIPDKIQGLPRFRIEPALAPGPFIQWEGNRYDLRGKRIGSPAHPVRTANPIR